MGKPCVAFQMESAREAWEHIRKVQTVVIDYGEVFEKNLLFVWDDGGRKLLRCKRCGGYMLCQSSERHDYDDSYDSCFPVTGPEEAEELNRRWNGEQIESYFPERYLHVDMDFPVSWEKGYLRNLGHKIEQLRKEAGYSQEQFAAQLGVPAQTLADWETLKQIPSGEILTLIESKLNLPFCGLVDSLIKEND